MNYISEFIFKLNLVDSCTLEKPTNKRDKNIEDTALPETG